MGYVNGVPLGVSGVPLGVPLWVGLRAYLLGCSLGCPLGGVELSIRDKSHLPLGWSRCEVVSFGVDYRKPPVCWGGGMGGGGGFRDPL